MGFHNGTYEGDWTTKWKPNNIEGCTLWTAGHSDNLKLYLDNVISWRDKSQNYQGLSKYTSNFSNGTDGWLEIANVHTAPFSVNGEEYCMQVLCTSTYAQHWNYKGTGFSWESNMIYFRAKIYINPLSNHITHVSFYGGANSVWYGYQPEKGVWTEISGYSYPQNYTGSNRFQEFRFFAFPSVFTGDETDWYAIKDVEYGFIDGNHFIQRDNNLRPSWDTSALVFNGTADYLDGSLNINNGNFRNDTQGEWFSVITCPSTHTRVHSLGFELDSSYCYFGIEPEDGSMRLSYWNFGNTKLKGLTYLNTDTPYIFNISSNSNRIRMGLNSREESIEVMQGTDNGDWISSMGQANVMQKGRFTATSTLYSPLIQKEEIYYNRELTNKERRSIFHYLNKKYNIY